MITPRLFAVILLAAISASRAVAADSPALHPVVEVEEQVYRYAPADNGAGPLWCSGSTCLARAGDEVFASGLETLQGVPPLNNCRWTLFVRGRAGWKLAQADPLDRTREPSPVAIFPDGQLFLSVNPTLRTNREPGGGPAQPRVLKFPTASPADPFQTRLPGWEGAPRFTEHSYRSFAADGEQHELIVFQNIDYSHAEWTFQDRQGNWSARGKLVWPWGADYEQPEPIRVCYPNVMLKNRAVYFCGVSDVTEPNLVWRKFKRELTGREWDYDFRRLFYTSCPDITNGRFQPWIELASREKTCGWISPGDLWVAPNGAIHIVWTERALDERLRAKFFPSEKQSHSLNYAVVRNDQVVLRRTLLEAREGGPNEIPSAARFQVTPDHRLFVFFYVQGSDSHGQSVSENRLMELHPDGTTGAPARILLSRPFTAAFTASVRAGSAPSATLDLLGQRAGEANVISYARVRLF